VKRLRNIGLVLIGIFIIYFAVAVVTSPASLAEAVTNPDDTIQLLFYKIARLEDKIAELEARITELERGGPEWKPPTEEDLPEANFPCIAQLPPELEGKIEVRYKFFFETEPAKVVMIEGRLKNLSNQDISGVWVKYTVKDLEGNVIFEPSEASCTYSEPLVKPGELRGLGGWGRGLEEDIEITDIVVELAVTNVAFS